MIRLPSLPSFPSLSSLIDPRNRASEARLAHALRTVPLFRELPAEELVAIWRHLEEVRVPAGGLVFEQGEPGDRLYLIKAGRVAVCLALEPEPVVICRLGPGDSFGEMALLTGQPRSASIVAAEDCVLWVLSRRDFEGLIANSIPLLRALNRALCDRLVHTSQQVGELMTAGIPAAAGVGGLRFGPYRVLEQIGAGGMAVVFSAIHVGTDATVALKVLPQSWGDAPELRARLRQEAAVLQRLAHPNVIHVHSVGEVEARAGGGCYLAMEFLPQALDRVIRTHYPEPLPVERALVLTHAVAEGLAAVHAADVVHRDVKPSNILLRGDGTPVLTDFGLAKVRAQRKGITAENVILGTADYISPEQVAGSKVDGRSDVYSLGVVLYEMLSAQVPFAGREPMQTLQAHLEEEPPPLPEEVPGAARAIVEQALQKRPQDRFASAAAMASAIRAALRN